MAYIPDITNSSLPDDTTIAETAQAEFRVIKSKLRCTLYRNPVPVGIVNTVVVSDLIPAYAVAAGILLTSKRLRLRLEGHYQNNTGGDQTYTIVVSYGATAIFTAALIVHTAAGPGFFEIDVEIGNYNGSAAQQECFSHITFYTAPTADGNFSGAAFGPLASMNFLVENSALAKNLTATVQMSVANPNLSISVNYGNIEFF